jgi:hypothetical protein
VDFFAAYFSGALRERLQTASVEGAPRRQAHGDRNIARLLGLGALVVSCLPSVLCIGKRGTHRPCGVLVAALGLLPAAASAQGFGAPPQPVESRGPVRLEAWAGYQFTTPISTTGGTINIDAAPSYGASLSLAVASDFELELVWTISDTHSQLVSNVIGGPSTIPNHLNINYFQAGITKSIQCGDFECFGEATLGAVLLVPGAVLLTSGEQVSVHDTWRTAFTLGAGVRFFVAERFALVLQARLLAPVYITSGSFYSGSGGATFVVSAGVPSVQGAFSAGLVLVL